MYRPTKLTLATVAAIATASAPSTASAFIPSDSAGGSAPSTGNVLARVTSPVAGTGSTASSSGFQWGDAGIGAAGTLLLIGFGSGAGVARRHRTGPLAG